MSTWPSPWTKELGTPNDPAIRFTRGTDFVATYGSQLLRPVRLLAPLDGSDREALPATGDFYFQAFDRFGRPSRRWI